MARDTIRYSEIFYSFQGEAQFAGKPTIWIRFFGCNLECNGFGQAEPTKPETHVLPYKDFDVSTVQKLEDLPVWNTGCDSSYSWSAKYKKLVHDDTVEVIVDKLTELMKDVSNPEGFFIHPDTNQDTMLAFTGGEPMLYQQAMIDIVNEFARRGNCPQTVTVETNATKPLSKELEDFICGPVTEDGYGTNTGFYDIGGKIWHWAMSPKLFNTSGEQDGVKIDVIQSYAKLPVSAILKFVVNGSEDTFAELDHVRYCLTEEFRELGGSVPEMWIMPAGATKDAQESDNVAKIAILGMKHGYNIATRNHCYVFGNVIGK